MQHSSKERWLTFVADTYIMLCAVGIIVLFWGTTLSASLTANPAFAPWIDTTRYVLFLCGFGVFTWYTLSLAKFTQSSRSSALLLIILILAFGIRLMLAPHPGYGMDVGTNEGWARSAAELGLPQSYTKQVGGTMLPNYPPLSMMIFAGTGDAFSHLWSKTFTVDSLALRFAIKFPAILADVAICILLFFFLRRWSIKAALAGALIYALHPAALHDTAIWGQTDSIFTCAVFASVFLASRNHWSWAGAFFAGACMLKVQACAGLPILLFSSFLYGRQATLRFIVGGIAATILVFFPFALGGVLPSIWNVYTHSVGFYSSMTMGSYNFWYALYGGSSGRSDTDLFMGLLTYRHLGYTLFSVATVSILAIVYKVLRRGRGPEAPRELALMLGAALLYYAFFMFCTQMHERYLFPYVALAIPLIVTGPRGIVLYVTSTLLIWLNIFDKLPVGSPGVIRLLNEFPARAEFIASAQTVIFFFTVFHVHRVMQEAIKTNRIGRIHRAFRNFWSSTRKLTQKFLSA